MVVWLALYWLLSSSVLPVFFFVYSHSSLYRYKFPIKNSYKLVMKDFLKLSDLATFCLLGPTICHQTSLGPGGGYTWIPT